MNSKIVASTWAFVISAYILIGISCAWASDDMANKLKVGLTKEAVIALFEGAPDVETCTTVLGISSCQLVWNRGFVQKVRYEVEFLAGRMVSFKTISQRSLF
jgi:hypothetical protein